MYNKNWRDVKRIRIADMVFQKFYVSQTFYLSSTEIITSDRDNKTIVSSLPRNVSILFLSILHPYSHFSLNRFIFYATPEIS